MFQPDSLLSIREHQNSLILKIHKEFFGRTINNGNSSIKKCRSQVLQENARKEFEQARNEKDAEVITRLILVSRDSLTKTLEKVDPLYLSIAKNVVDSRQISIA